MRYFIFLLSILLIALSIYYFSAIFHILFNVFGKTVTFPKLLIPFYGWIKILKN